MEHSVKILLFLILTSLTSPLLAADWTIGILALRGETATRTHWQSLVDSLNHAVPDANFRLLPLDLDGMREAVNQGTIQFVLTNPGQFVQLNSHYHLRWLSSLRSGQGDALESMATGSTILVRDGSGITHPQDLAGKTLGAVDTQAFGGYLLGYRALRDAGLQVDESKVRFVGFPADALLYLLREDAIQAAIVPACLLESMDSEGLIDKSQFHVLLQQNTAFHCLTSTPLYPDWSFAALPGVDDRVADAVTRALLSSPRWGAPTSTSDTEALLRELNRHPEQQRIGQTVIDWMRQHRLAIGLGLLLVALFIANYGWVMVLVNRRGKALEQAHNQLRAQQQALEQARQMNMLGEMASGFAHELNQPLAAIRMYAQGGLNHLSAAENHAAVEKALINIESQAERCGLIIRHLREWATPARQNEHATENYIPCDVAGTLKQVLTLLQLDKAAPGLSVCLNSHQSIMLFLPPVLLEQVLANIILNAVQAGACNLWIDLHRDEQQYLIALQDDAGGIPAEQISDLFRPFHSGKKTGMGLGLVICQRLLRGVHGEISVNNHRAPDGSEGVRVTLTFPADDNNGKTQ
ncbi:PhnD/SsuA/transferrin family substrate-binding protein [Leclercia adecarboxylata]|uniref:tetrathionate respiration histidine kinase TtrS n=1 Tax=Leclercia adecarboxylata TaxID=83655 RepID=UPI000744C1FB|nr:tetrathionate respiration histidine kinase TtrS [Leclercia adecarboxylata]ALZ97156.1 histidine kinase [Leclercia adecarboxylata]MBM6632748.1 PhnD/SsuA/transferrin family substrate-binding protein [Leclercia adecarboxylata]MDH0064137.1 tetrathionate respiration histidine kinase TtrS [Leclercia adecarboxylata]UFM71102.1 PhnD/SsuA/transferrin family substrate-binding protein [Leclercia adecarboxylata]